MSALDAITLGVVTARGMAKRIRQSERMNVVLPCVAKPHSRRNDARMELAAKR